MECVKNKMMSVKKIEMKIIKAYEVDLQTQKEQKRSNLECYN